MSWRSLLFPQMTRQTGLRTPAVPAGWYHEIAERLDPAPRWVRGRSLVGVTVSDVGVENALTVVRRSRWIRMTVVGLGLSALLSIALPVAGIVQNRPFFLVFALMLPLEVVTLIVFSRLNGWIKLRHAEARLERVIGTAAQNRSDGT